jgi:hypothetical protein
VWRSKLIVTAVAFDLAIKVIVSIILSSQASPLPLCTLMFLKQLGEVSESVFAVGDVKFNGRYHRCIVGDCR